MSDELKEAARKWLELPDDPRYQSGELCYPPVGSLDMIELLSTFAASQRLARLEAAAKAIELLRQNDAKPTDRLIGYDEALEAIRALIAQEEART